MHSVTLILETLVTSVTLYLMMAIHRPAPRVLWIAITIVASSSWCILLFPHRDLVMRTRKGTGYENFRSRKRTGYESSVSQLNRFREYSISELTIVREHLVSQWNRVREHAVSQGEKERAANHAGAR